MTTDLDRPTDWTKDRAIASCARSMLSAALRHAIMDAPQSPMRGAGYVYEVLQLATDFEGEPEHMGVAVATIWQKRAFELSYPDERARLAGGGILFDAALQVAAIVYQLAKRQGGAVCDREFGFVTLFVRTTGRGLRSGLDFDLLTANMSPRDMLEFVCLRAAELGVPLEDIAAKKARRGL